MSVSESTTPDGASLPLIQPLTSPNTLSLLAFAFAVVVVALILLVTRRTSKAKGSIVLLAGIPDSGKTAILSTLVYGQTLPTHTSLQSNSSVFTLEADNGKSIPTRMVDVPGHPRIRSQFKEFLPFAKTIVFVVDASTLARNGASVAEHLHEILQALSNIPPSQSNPALLILAHKSDLVPSGSAVSRTKTILERQLSRRQEGTGISVSEESEADTGGLECSGGPGFRFADWDGGEVSFAASSVAIGGTESSTKEKANDEKDGLAELKDWLLQS